MRKNKVFFRPHVFATGPEFLATGRAVFQRARPGPCPPLLRPSVRPTARVKAKQTGFSVRTRKGKKPSPTHPRVYVCMRPLTSFGKQERGKKCTSWAEVLGWVDTQQTRHKIAFVCFAMPQKNPSVLLY